MVDCRTIAISDRSTSQGKDTGAAKNIKLTATYAPLETALRNYSWAGLTRKQTKELNPAAIFSILGEYVRIIRDDTSRVLTPDELAICHFTAMWEYQSRHHGALPDDVANAGDLENIAAELLSKSGINKQALPNVPKELLA